MADQRDMEDKGGTMRLGLYPARLTPGSKAAAVYGEEVIYERHRHRFEVNNRYRQTLEGAGMLLSGQSPDGRLVEIVELKDHPWFVASQFHPEFKSRPERPHPLFDGFVGASIAVRPAASRSSGHDLSRRRRRSGSGCRRARSRRRDRGGHARLTATPRGALAASQRSGPNGLGVGLQGTFRRDRWLRAIRPGRWRPPAPRTASFDTKSMALSQHPRDPAPTSGSAVVARSQA